MGRFHRPVLCRESPLMPSKRPILQACWGRWVFNTCPGCRPARTGVGFPVFPDLARLTGKPARRDRQRAVTSRAGIWALAHISAFLFFCLCGLARPIAPQAHWQPSAPARGHAAGAASSSLRGANRCVFRPVFTLFVFICPCLYSDEWASKPCWARVSENRKVTKTG